MRRKLAKSQIVKQLKAESYLPVHKNMNTILVIGSLNTDMVIQTEKIPTAGETVLGGEFFMNTGGKGANQAVAASRLGGKVTFIGKVGDDIFGENGIRSLKEEGIETTFVGITSGVSSGVAMITVDKKGENAIVVAPGANYRLTIDDIENAFALFYTNDFILLQLEIPVQTVEYIIVKAKSLGKKVILNPAPAQKLNADLLKGLYMITPNEREAEALTGIKIGDETTAKEAAQRLLEKGIETVIITLGEKGALVKTQDVYAIVPSPRVEAVDTTAAGDTFNGALAVALSEGKDIVAATSFACRAASISVARKGAQISMPYRKEIDSIVD